MGDYTKGEYCLGNSCRFYNESPDAICFKQGVLPHCSPELKQRRKSIDNSAVDMYEALKAVKEARDYLEFNQAELKVDTALAKAERGK